MTSPAQFTVKTNSRLLDIDKDYDDVTHRYSDSYLNPTYELELDAYPGGEPIDLPIDIEGPRGKPIDLGIVKLNIPADADAYVWRITSRDGAFEKKVTTPIQRTTIGDTEGVYGTPYKLTVEVPGPNIYDIHLQLRLRFGGGPTHIETFDLQDFLVVSIGDSYASGEGNPDRPGTPEGFDLDVEWWKVAALPLIVVIGLPAFIVTTAALDWGADYLKRKFTTLSRAADAKLEMDPEPIWLEENAHRSLRAGPAIAARLLEDIPVGDLVTFVSFARSGAEIQDGLFDPRTADGKPIDGWIGNVGELDELKDLRNRIGDRPIDALVISIGGNDAGFSGRLKDMVARDNPFLLLIGGELGLGDDTDVRETARQQVEEALNDLHTNFQKLAKEIDSLNVHQVYLTEYPTAHFDRIQNGEVVVAAGCGLFTSHFDADIDRADAQLMRESAERLNEVLRQEADSHDWVYVGGIAEGFEGRGYCMDEESYFVSAEESLVLQGDTDGLMHPNGEGHCVYAEQIAGVLREYMLEGESVSTEELSIRRSVAPYSEFTDRTLSVRELLSHFSPTPPNSLRALLQRI